MHDVKTITGFYCGPRTYKYDGWLFEVSYYYGPWPLRKDGEQRKRANSKFWDMWEGFSSLSDDEQEKYGVGGGCQHFTFVEKQGV